MKFPVKFPTAENSRATGAIGIMSLAGFIKLCAGNLNPDVVMMKSAEYRE